MLLGECFAFFFVLLLSSSIHCKKCKGILENISKLLELDGLNRDFALVPEWPET